MRLLFITNDFPSPMDSTKGIFNLHLARALSHTHSVQVVSPVSWVDHARAFMTRSKDAVVGSAPRANGMVVHYPSYYYPPKVFRDHYAFYYWMSIKSTVKTILSEAPPDAVIGYWAHPDGAAAVRIAQRLGVPGAVIVGGSDVLLLARDRKRRACISRVLRQADSVITVSSDLKSKIVDLDVPEAKIHLWERGLDRRVFQRGDKTVARKRLGLAGDAPIIVWVGRFVHVKGLDVLLRASEKLARSGVRFQLYLIGDGPLRKTLEAERAERGLESSIHFVGKRLPHELADWYRAADFVVLPSRSEGLPNVLREALACGTPFVATNVGGISQLASPRSSLLVPAENSDALAEAMECAMSGQLSVPDHAPLLDWATSAENLVRIIQERRTP